MKPLEKAHVQNSPEKRERIIVDCMAAFKMTREEVEASVIEEEKQEIWMNDVYTVVKRPAQPGIIWLSIKRTDKEICRDWRDFQEIKNQLVGPECEGLEVYPAESRLVDTANQYHLWVFTDPTYRMPFGFDHGRCVQDFSTRDSKQRPLGESNVR